jgi:hypothetical protein
MTKNFFKFISVVALTFGPWLPAIAPTVCGDDYGGPVYVGSKACEACHPDEYENFVSFAKKAASYESVLKMRKGLTAAELKSCYACHTTGYGRPGGFRSEAETPHLKNAGCEVCHGPGSVHADSGDPRDLGAAITIEDCRSCHNNERVESFGFKPMLYGGAH